MKSLCVFSLIVVLLVAGTALGGVPQKISFQGYLSTLAHDPLSGQHILTFTIYDAQTAGTDLWSDSDTLSVEYGQFHTYLGKNNPLPGSMFAGGILWLETRVDGGLLPERQPLVSVAYSFHSETADDAVHAQMADTANIALNCPPDTGGSLWDTDGTDIYRTQGKVGIGTTAPTVKLDVVADPNTTGLIISHTGTSGFAGQQWGAASGRLNSNGCQLLVYPDDDPTYPGCIRFGGGTGTALLEFLTGSAGNFGFRTGNVGIGTVVPRAKLEVSGYNPGQIWNCNTCGNKYYLHLHGNNPAGGTIGWQFDLVNNDVTYTPLALQYGNVGIGTTEPAVLLEVRKEAGGGQTLFKVSGYHGDSNSVHVRTNGDVLEIKHHGYNINQKALYVNHDGNGYGAYILGKSYFDGNVGIGTTSPSAALDVAGSVNVQGNLCVLGQKNAVVSTSQGMTKVYSEESAEVWFTDYGSGVISEGRAHVDLDPRFLETVVIDEQHPIKVFLQQTSGEPANLVVHRGTRGFEVVCSNDSQQAAFDYRVVAKRKGYEEARLEVVGK